MITPMLLAVFHYLEDNNLDITAPRYFSGTIEALRRLNERMPKVQQGIAEIELVVPVVEPVVGAGEIKQYRLHGGKMAAIVHRGPVEECRTTYERLFAWLDANHLPVTGPIREVYLNDPRDVLQEDLLTQIYVPVG